MAKIRITEFDRHIPKHERPYTILNYGRCGTNVTYIFEYNGQEYLADITFIPGSTYSECAIFKSVDQQLTFDNAIPLYRKEDVPMTYEALEDCIDEFLQQNKDNKKEEQYMRKNTLIIKEMQLRNIVKESVRRILKESNDQFQPYNDFDGYDNDLDYESINDSAYHYLKTHPSANFLSWRKIAIGMGVRLETIGPNDRETLKDAIEDAMMEFGSPENTAERDYRDSFAESKINRIIKESVKRALMEDKLRKVTLGYLKSMVRDGFAIDISTSKERPEPLEKVGYSEGKFGCNGLWFVGRDTGQHYVVIDRTANLWRFDN